MSLELAKLNCFSSCFCLSSLLLCALPWLSCMCYSSASLALFAYATKGSIPAGAIANLSNLRHSLLMKNVSAVARSAVAWRCVFLSWMHAVKISCAACCKRSVVSLSWLDCFYIAASAESKLNDCCCCNLICLLTVYCCSLEVTCR